MRTARLLLLGLTLALLGGSSLRAEDPAVPEAEPLTVRRLFDGRPFTASLPNWSWRPGHSELVRLTDRPRTDGNGRSQVLQARALATGQERDLLDFDSLQALVQASGPGARGIGRAGPGRYVWAPSGTALCAVVRGNLVWVDLAAATQTVLTRTEAPLSDIRVAPDAKHVSFVREHDLWSVPTSGGEPLRLTSGGSEEIRNASLDWVYPEELGHDTGHWWAPDGERVAFLQLDERKVPLYRVPGLSALRSEGRTMRYPKVGDPNPVARVGVVPCLGGDPVWMDLGTPAPEYVVRVTWLPADQGLLILTLDRPQRALRIHLCDPKTGTSRVLLKQTDPAWIVPPPAPRIHDGKWLLLRSEPDAQAWFAYRLPSPSSGPDLGPPLRLTPPGVDAGQLHHLVMGEAGPTQVIYQGSAHGSAREGVWLSDGTSPRPLFDAGERGSLTAQLSTTGENALVSRSAQDTPPRLELWRVNEAKALEVLGDTATPELGQLELAQAEVGELEIPDCTTGKIRYRLWRPRTLDPGRRYGLLVHVYGGPGSRMVQDAWGRGPLLATLFNQRGILVLEVDGRGSEGNGREFTRLVQGRLGLLELEDQVRVVKEIGARPYVDPKRVGIWGWSYGGFMSCLALALRSDVFVAGVAVASVTDWRLYDSIYTERYMGLLPENEKGYDETSCVVQAAGVRGHLLLLHGIGDDNVHAQNTIRFIDALISRRITNYDAMLYPGRGHGIEGAGYDVFHRLVRHMEQHLGQ